MTATQFPTGIIPPEAVAYKMARWQNFQTPQFAKQLKALPRLKEVAWFIQWQSMQPGGLNRFIEEFLSAFSDRIGTHSMHRYGKKTEVYSGEERKVIAHEIPRFYEHDKTRPGAAASAAFWAETRDAERDDSGRRPVLAHRSKLNYPEFHAVCESAAHEHLARHLAEFCICDYDPKDAHRREEENDGQHIEKEDRPLRDVWYFRDLPGALSEMLAAHTERARQSLAMTAVAKKCFDALEYSWAENGLVMIEGDTRFGKTQSVRTWAESLPGRARLVKTPCSNSELDLFRAVAEAVGMEVTLKTPGRELKTKVEFVIRHGGLMFIFDEAHFLIPARFEKNTPPMRLNWIRTQIVDQGCPLALVTTPQEFKHGITAFTLATGHNISQFLGRSLWTVPLPNKLDIEDMIAVARKHFPELDEDHLILIAGIAKQSEAYLMAVETIGRRARYIARREGHPKMTMADLKTAIAEIIPAPQVPNPQPPAIVKQPIATKRGRALAPEGRQAAPPIPPALEAPARAITPATEVLTP